MIGANPRPCTPGGFFQPTNRKGRSGTIHIRKAAQEALIRHGRRQHAERAPGWLHLRLAVAGTSGEKVVSRRHLPTVRLIRAGATFAEARRTFPPRRSSFARAAEINPDERSMSTDTGIRISIEEMLSEELIREIGADHEDPCVCVTRLCGYVRRLEEDKTRLDWLELCRRRLNTACGSSYGWQVIQSHLVNRLMFKTPEVCEMAGIDLNDTGHPGTSIREAIDAARKSLKTS